MSQFNGPKVGSFNHASIPVRNLKEAKRFYTEVLGGEVILDSNPGFAEVRVGGAIIGLSEQQGGWTGSNAEFPHYSKHEECRLISRGPDTAWKRLCTSATRPGISWSSIASVG